MNTSVGTPHTPGCPDVDLEPLRREVHRALAQERGVVARLRSLRTSHRILLVVLLAALVTLAAALATPRHDLGEVPFARMMATLAVFAALTAAASWRMLRPLHAPPPSMWSGRALIAAGLLSPCLFALGPLEHVGLSAGEGADFVACCGKCIGFGGALALPVFVLALLARRSTVDGAVVAALGGVAAGLTGNLGLQVHCAVTEPAHVLASHELLVLVSTGTALLWRRR
jgi:hypothetical protein